MYFTLFYYSLLIYPKLIPFWSITDRQTDFNTPFTLTSFFFPLSARGPTRRRNSTGLDELWGGWPINQVKNGAELFWREKKLYRTDRDLSIAHQWRHMKSFVTIELEQKWRMPICLLTHLASY